MPLQRVAWISLLFGGVALAGINWKSVWLEPLTPVVLTVGEAKPYTVMGRNGADVKADLTKSPNLKITSSDAEILEVNPQTGTFVGKKPGHVDIRIAFSEATEMVPAFVRPSKTGTTTAVSAPSNDVDGVWKAVFTGDLGERPKMVSEIAFALDSSGSALSGVVHAAYWPGDAAVSDGKVDGDRITFTMTGHLPFNANGVTGYPKLCFTGVRNGGEMKLDLLWTEARNTCDKGKLLPMAGRKVTDRARRDEIRIRPCGSWSGYCGLYTAISETDLIQVHNRMVMERIPTFLEVAWRVSMGVWRTANGMDVS